MSLVLDRDLKDVVLVGHSWGGYPVTDTAHALAGRVRRVAADLWLSPGGKLKVAGCPGPAAIGSLDPCLYFTDHIDCIGYCCSCWR
ncbi:hypothetical protein ACGFXB_45520 [Streptomyces canus]|jgi:pimeloyl-ACP methyl ester carboxylesterase|uniref:hypothetical protein n=1 Tax=Streptomyces canus TaxID=58343 RepID=UPI003721CAE3